MEFLDKLNQFYKLKNMTEKALDFLDIDVEDNYESPYRKSASAHVDRGQNFHATSPARTTPPPPPPPCNEETMSVYIAMSGQTYGPYERDALLEMVSRGALTRDTMVYMDGMSAWLPAKDVEKVNKLFVGRFNVSEVPAVPSQSSNSKFPMPPAPPEEIHAKPKELNNGLSAKLNNLIIAAVADGEISDLERQVLIRNAQAENVPMDEFVMMLEAKLYERRQELLERQKTQESLEKNRDLNARLAMAEAQAKVNAATTPPPASAPQSPSQLTKCPACGAPVKSLATRCPDCGTEYNTVGIETKTSWYYLCEKLEAIDLKYNSRSQLSKIFSLDDDPIDEKIQAIRQFPVSNTKEDIVDFFSYCAPLAKKSRFNDDSIENAYYRKAQQVLNKAYIVLADSPDMLRKIELIATQYKIKR